MTDARGQPPSMPFWLGESLGRSDELCRAVSRLTEGAEARLDAAATPDEGLAACRAWLAEAMLLPEAAADQLADRWEGQVTVAYAAGTPPTVPDAVAAARTAGAATVAVASYLLAEGFFHDRLAEAGADHVTAPLGGDDAVLAVILSRLSAG